MRETAKIEDLATRPPMAPGGLPLKLASFLVGLGAILIVLLNDTPSMVVSAGSVAIVWGAIRPLVARDYHGFDIFINWCRFDLPHLDRNVWGGTRPTPFPLRLRPYGMPHVH